MSHSRTPGAPSCDEAVTENSAPLSPIGWAWGFGLLLVSAALSVVGAWSALSAEGPPRNLIHLQRALQERRSLTLGSFPERAAGALVHRWEGLGLHVSDGGVRGPAGWWQWRAASPEDPEVVEAAAAAGLKIGPSRWNHASLVGVRSGGALAVLTVLQGSGTLRTLVFSAKGPDEWGASESDSVDALSRSLPAPRPELRLYEDGALRLSVPLNDQGAPRRAQARTWDLASVESALRSCAADGESDPDGERLELEWARVEALAKDRGLELGTRPGALWVRELGEGSAPHQKAGWYSHLEGRMLMACAVARAPRDAIAAWVLADFCGGLSGDFRLSPEQTAFLADIEALGPSTADREGRAPTGEDASLPRAVAVRYGGSLERSHAAFGTAAGALELQEISSLGFGAVCLEVLVPVVSPTDRAGLPLEFGPWASGRSRSVTLEGDAAVLLAAEQARAAGLKVVLWPQLLTGPSGGLLGLQAVASPEHWHELSGRLRETSALVAGLAQEMRADALVLFDHYFLPTEGEDNASGKDAEALEVRRSARIAVLDGAAGFRGPKVCVAGSPRALSFVQGAPEFLAPGVVLGLDLSAGLSGAAGDLRHDSVLFSRRFKAASAKLGPGLQLIQLSVPGTQWARRGRESWGGATDAGAREDYLQALIEGLGEADDVPFIVARGWAPGGGVPRGFDVSRWPAALQRKFAASR